jgi:SSS family solute:Na+ symporter
MVKANDHPAYPWLGTIFGTLILGIWYWCTDQVIVQKTLSAKGIPDARKGAFFCAALKILPVFILVLPGLIAKALWPDAVTGDNAYPMLVKRLMPPGLSGLMIAALLAALMSSLSSVFNSCSTLITMDVYKKVHPEASEKKLVFIGRVTTAAIVVVSVLWIPFIRNLNNEVYQYLQSVQAYVGAPITATFLVGILWRGATAPAALTTLLTGGFIGAARFSMDILHNAMKMDLGPMNAVVEYSFLNFSVWVFLFCVALMVAVSLPTAAKSTDGVGAVSLKIGHFVRGTVGDVAFTGVVGTAILALWYHFR